MSSSPRFERFALTLLALAWISLFGNILHAEPAWSFIDNTKLSLDYNAGYDNNVLELSEADIERFEQGRLGFRTDVSTYDDLVQSLGASFSVESPEWIGWRSGYLYYSIRHQAHLRNRFNDRSLHYIFARHDLVERVDIVTTWMLIPQRYLRDYYDRDFGSVGAASFNYERAQLGLRWSPSALRGLRLTGGLMSFTVYYNPHYTEYDVEGAGLWAELRYRINRSWTLNGEFQYRDGENVGYTGQQLDPIDAPDVDSEYGDGSYGEEWYELSLDFRPRKRWLERRWEFSASARLRHRFYTSELQAEHDPAHRGRQHNQLRFGLDASTEIVSGLEAGPWIDYELRNTNSPFRWVERVKDFRALRAGIEVSYRIW